MGIVGSNTDTEGNHTGVHAGLAAEGERLVSATGATTYELSFFVCNKFDTIQRSPLGCANVGDVLIIFEMERLFNDLTTGPHSPQPCVLVPIPIVRLLIVNLVPLYDDRFEPAIVGLIERHMVHLSELIMFVMLRYQKVLHVIGLLGVRIDWSMGVCPLNLLLIVFNELLELLLLSCEPFLFLSNKLSLFFLLKFDSLTFRFGFESLALCSSFGFSFKFQTLSFGFRFESLTLCFSFGFKSMMFGLSFKSQTFSFGFGFKSMMFGLSFKSQTFSFGFLSLTLCFRFLS
jgi:hypothetical protein